MKILKNKESKIFFNILSFNTDTNGSIIIDGNFRIDGKLTGSIQCDGTLTIGSSGYVEGKIKCKNATISGKVIGDIIGESIVLNKTAKINGTIIADKLVVELGAIITASCDRLI